MKKFLLTIIAIIIISISNFAQSYIGESKEYILKDISPYALEYSFKDNVLSVTLSDHSAVYAINDKNVCIFYMLFYDSGSDVSNLIDDINAIATKVTDYYKWYVKVSDYYIYYKINVTSTGVIVFSVYPDFYEDNVDSVIIKL